LTDERILHIKLAQIHILEEEVMKSVTRKCWRVVLFLCVLGLVIGCSNNDQKKQETAVPAVSETPAVNSDQNVSAVPESQPQDAAASVDGKILKKSELDKNVNEIIKKFKDKIPADKVKEAKENVRKQMINTFVLRTLLSNEIEKRNIQATDREIQAAKDKIKANIPPSKNVDEFLKENGITREELAFAVKVDKFRDMETANKAKPSSKEITKFYNENREKLFVESEAVHVRHILVAVKAEDDEKTKAQKKEKIEGLRKQLLAGADFSELARKNSDCPSKDVGGDLNFIRRGQTVKEFENAAFSQEKNAIGPVVQTEYGYHIIQVLERKPANKIALEKVKDKIAAYLEQQKKMQIFNDVIKNLQQNAKIIIY